MTSDSPRTDLAFRAEARDWLEENKPREARPHDDAAAERAYDMAWQRRQFDAGWAGIGWPVAHGGRGLSLTQQLIWSEECARAGLRAFNGTWLGINHAGPTVMALGTDAQKRKHLPAILRGEELWCQGFSEPNAGSDLAGVRTRGVVDGDDLVVTGQKTWTTLAHLADYQELLVRTDPDSKRFKGLTWIICDMRLPGITIRPMRSIAGELHNCEVFYDEVRIPLSNVVGRLHDGWTVAMTTLAFERGTASFGEATALEAHLHELFAYARSTRADDGRLLMHNEAIAQQLGALRAEVDGLKALLQLTIARQERGTPMGSEGSIVRLYMTELYKRVTRVGVQMLGVQALDRTHRAGWIHDYFEAFAQTIAGGTSEIQRNVIGERLLGLPR